MSEPARLEEVAPSVFLLRGFANASVLMRAIERVAARAPFRHLVTPGGGRMSVAMTNCGPWGWHSDRRGYRYVAEDPATGQPWPAMPDEFRALAQQAAALAGFGGFEPDCCLVNRYEPGAQMGSHRDFDELDMRHPIVSVSIGLPATFVWYGEKRSAPDPVKLELHDGDVLVWGGPSRAGYHAVKKLAAPASGADLFADADSARGSRSLQLRYNLTFRRAR